jgi:hypothetical protein
MHRQLLFGFIEVTGRILTMRLEISWMQEDIFD